MKRNPITNIHLYEKHAMPMVSQFLDSEMLIYNAVPLSELHTMNTTSALLVLMDITSQYHTNFGGGIRTNRKILI